MVGLGGEIRSMPPDLCGGSAGRSAADLFMGSVAGLPAGDSIAAAGSVNGSVTGLVDIDSIVDSVTGISVGFTAGFSVAGIAGIVGVVGVVGSVVGLGFVVDSVTGCFVAGSVVSGGFVVAAGSLGFIGDL